MSDRRSYSVTITTPMAPNFCAGAYPLGEDGNSPTYWRGAVAKCDKGHTKRPFLLKAKSGRTPMPTWKSTRDRRHHYTTLTNARASFRRQGEHSSLALNSCQAC